MHPVWLWPDHAARGIGQCCRLRVCGAARAGNTVSRRPMPALRTQHVQAQPRRPSLPRSAGPARTVAAAGLERCSSHHGLKHKLLL
ncbi:MAG: hypothetical protein ACK559_28525, partial [bacterium]